MAQRLHRVILGGAVGPPYDARPDATIDTADEGDEGVTAARGAAVIAATPLHVLLVEDHPDTAAAMAAMLRFWGHEVTVALSVGMAEGAVSRAVRAGRPFDLVISDINLPDGTGWELMHDLQRRYQLRGIALSGFERAEDLRRSREAGFAEHLVKPVNPRALAECIDRTAGGAAHETGRRPSPPLLRR